MVVSHRGIPSGVPLFICAMPGTFRYKHRVAAMKKRVVGLGEVLWDVLPERTCLGGAPANFAYITTLMGDQGIVASRVGEDSRGIDALRRMEELGLDIDHVQTDREHATGTVSVEVDSNGLPHYEIAAPVAWDFLQWTADL